MIADLAATTPSVVDLLVGWRLLTSLVGAMVIAVLAGRLLGVRRSWGSSVLSGLVGWVSGAILAVVLARSHEGGEAGFTATSGSSRRSSRCRPRCGWRCWPNRASWPAPRAAWRPSRVRSAACAGDRGA